MKQSLNNLKEDRFVHIYVTNCKIHCMKKADNIHSCISVTESLCWIFYDLKIELVVHVWKKMYKIVQKHQNRDVVHNSKIAL